MIRRFLALLTPSPFAAFVSILAALAVGYLLCAELEPLPRHIAVSGPVGFPSSWQSAFSLDGSLMVFHFEGQGESGAGRSAVHFYDLSNNKGFVLSAEMSPPIVFAPDGQRIAGFWQDTLYVWDRATGAERKRYSVKKVDFKPRFAFTPDALVLANAWITDGKGKVQKHLIDLDANRAWNGTEKEFDRLHDEQQELITPRRNVISADGKRTISMVRSGFVVSDAAGKPLKSITLSQRFEISDDASISPDGKTLIVPGWNWLPFQTAYAWLKSAYLEGKDPHATAGTLLVDIDSGAEIVFVKRSGDFAVTPDGKSFVLMERSFHDSSVTLTIYDWPLTKPWWRIGGGALLVFVALVLMSKALRWLRGKRKVDEEDAPRIKPPWETEAGAAEIGADA
jgi:hypothetical protein